MLLNKQIPFQERLNFAVYALSRFILSVGSDVYLFAVSYYILYETESAFYFSINMAISVLVTVALLPFSGLLSDMKNKRRIIISGESLNTLVILGLFIYTIFFDINLIAIYMVTFLNSLIEPFVSNSFQTAITELFHKNRVQKVMGYTSALLSASIILGPILGGVLFGLLSFNYIILIFFIGCFISTILDFLLKFDLYYQRYLYEAQGEMEKGLVKFKQNITEGFRFIFNSDVFKSLLIIAALANFMTGIISIFPEKMMIVELGFEPEAVGIVNAAAGLGVLIGGVIVGKSKQFENPFLLMKRGFLVYAALCLLYLLPLYLGLNTISNIIFIGMVGIGFTLTLQFINVPLNVFLQFVTPQHIKGRVFSTISLFSGSITPLGAIIFGFLYDFGLYWPVNLGSALMMIMIVYIFYSNRLIDTSKKMYKKAKMDAETDISENRPEEKREMKSPETETQEM